MHSSFSSYFSPPPFFSRLPSGSTLSGCLGDCRQLDPCCGSTEGRPSGHPIRDLALAQASAMVGISRWDFPGGACAPICRFPPAFIPPSLPSIVLINSAAWDNLWAPRHPHAGACSPFVTTNLIHSNIHYQQFPRESERPLNSL